MECGPNSCCLPAKDRYLVGLFGVIAFVVSFLRCYLRYLGVMAEC